MQSIISYRDYLLHQVMNHPDFDFENNPDAFKMVGLDDTLGTLRSNEDDGDLLFRAVRPTYRINKPEGKHEFRKYYVGGWMIGVRFSNRDEGDEGLLLAYERAEKLNDEFLEKMVADSQNGHPFLYFSFNHSQQTNTQFMPHVNGTDYAGILTTFQISNYFRACSTDENAPAWLDGGLTDY